MQLTLLVTGVVLARALGPEDRGYMALLTVVAAIAWQLGGLGIPFALTYAIARVPAAAERIIASVRGAIATQVVLATIGAGLVLAALARLPNGGRLIKSHEGRNFPPGQRCRRAVYLVRDGRDVAVSYYFFMQRYAEFSGPFSEFLPMFLKGRVDGYGPWHLHVRSWLESPLAASEDLLAIRYEDMLRNPEEILGRVVEFVGAAADPTRLHDAIEAHRFERMRQRSRESPTMKAKAVRDDISTVRRGKAGNWRDHFSKNDCALFSRYAGGVLERYGYDPF